MPETFEPAETLRLPSELPHQFYYSPLFGTFQSFSLVSAPKLADPPSHCPVSANDSFDFSIFSSNEPENPPVLEGIGAVVGQHVLYGGGNGKNDNFDVSGSGKSGFVSVSQLGDKKAEEEAARAYDAAARKLRGSKARTNFEIPSVFPLSSPTSSSSSSDVKRKKKNTVAKSLAQNSRKCAVVTSVAHLFSSTPVCEAKSKVNLQLDLKLSGSFSDRSRASMAVPSTI
ncbi:hypothetical protein F0562_023113 [Nyssa sinensis]|uniref:AP2/ERF domain-containing protein n=1 Tax=Nyssa sinensis TaxID=561372 RepID=A0A5J5BLE2_9ASTE|nr:hypothetical protein F0562_023113 [Nyssa sinensis]